MISHELVAKIDLEVRHVRNEALSYPTSSLVEPFVNKITMLTRMMKTCFQDDETRKTYLGMLTALDDAVGRIVNHLKRLPLKVPFLSQGWQWFVDDRMTYKEEGKERSIFDDTVIIFTSTNGALTPEVQYWKKTNMTKNPTHRRALEQEVAQTRPWEAAWATCSRGEPGFLPLSQIWTRFPEN